MPRTDEAFYASLTNMGGFMQPQGHVQLLLNLVAHGMDPQRAIDMPRFCICDGTAGGAVAIEEGFSPTTVTALRALGHPILQNGLMTGHERAMFGRAQIITRSEDGVLCGGSDGRADGCAMGY